MDRFICTSLDASQQCQQWEPVGSLMLTVEQHAAISAAILLVFAVAFGIRVVLRQLFNR